MSRLTSILCACLTLVLFHSGLAQTGLTDLNDASANGQSYAAMLTGQDAGGEFSAVYYCSDDFKLMKRKDRDGVTVYRYQKSKRPDKVMVTRAGVSYFYRLDNPRLPHYFLESLDTYLEKEQKFGSQANEELTVDTGDGATLVIKELTYNPSPDDPRFRDVTRYVK